MSDLNNMTGLMIPNTLIKKIKLPVIDKLGTKCNVKINNFV